jgi:hypothetical protein
MPETPTAPTPMIPDGDPQSIALALLVAAAPDAPAVLAARVDAATEVLAQLQEHARLEPGLSLEEFIRQAARTLLLRSALRDRQGRLDPSLKRSGSPVHVELAGLIRSIKRWKTGEELKASRARLAEAWRGRLGAAEAEVQQVVATIRSGATLVVPANQGHHATGMVHPHDEALRRLEDALTKRAAARDRLARLDPHGDAGRSAAVRDLVGLASGAEALASQIAPGLDAPAKAEAEKCRRQIADVTAKIHSTDDATRLHASLVEQRDGLQGRLQAASDLVLKQQAQSAGSIVAGALAGSLAAVRELEQAVRPVRPELAEALSVVRGDDEAIVSVVAELIAPQTKGGNP